MLTVLGLELLGTFRAEAGNPCIEKQLFTEENQWMWRHVSYKAGPCLELLQTT
jgi:hypothetical protein